MLVKLYLKGIFTDSNNIFLLHESEDINEKKIISKISVDSNLCFHVMHDYVCFIVPIDYCVEQSLVYETFCENCSHFVLK